jgi:hypothetical protein
LVRLGLRYLRGFYAGKRPESADAIHLLNPDERKALRGVERGAIARAAIAGALSTIVSATVELTVARPLLGPKPRYATFADEVRFYAVVGAATIVASVIEILFLYWDGLRSVHRLAHEAGLDLFPGEDDDKAISSAMARAALELPNPAVSLFGVDPRREASRLRLVVASIVYKAKISVTNFLVKALVRRALGRAFVRSWLPFVAVPLTAAWNAVVCWLIMREARIRAMGPSAAREMIDVVFAGQESDLSAEAKACALRAVASSIVRTEDLHPNLVALFREVGSRVGGAVNERAVGDRGDLDDTRAFLERLRGLGAKEQTDVLRILAIASIIDGRLTRAERRLLTEARAACGREPDLASIERLRRAFVDGDPIDPRKIADVA